MVGSTSGSQYWAQEFDRKSSISTCVVIHAHCIFHPLPVCSSPSPQPSAQDNLLAALLTCDVIVYDVVEEQTQVEEASWAVQGEGGEREERKEKKEREERGRGTSITGIAHAPPC